MTIRFLNPSETAYVRDSINNDPEFRLASRFFSKDILLIVGDAKCIVKLRDGNVTEIKLNPTFMNPWSFFIKGSAKPGRSSCSLFHRRSLPTCTAAYHANILSSAAILKPPSPTIGR